MRALYVFYKLLSTIARALESSAGFSSSGGGKGIIDFSSATSSLVGSAAAGGGGSEGDSSDSIFLGSSEEAIFELREREMKNERERGREGGRGG